MRELWHDLSTCWRTPLFDRSRRHFIYRLCLYFSDHNVEASSTTNDDEITIDDNWLNEVLNINESSIKYNQVIIDQEPKTVQLPPLVTDDEDDVDGSGSGDGIIINNSHKVADKITGIQ